MTTTAQAAAFVLSALVTVATLAGVNAVAAQEYRKADAVVATAAAPVLALQTVVVVGHRA